LCVCVL